MSPDSTDKHQTGTIDRVSAAMNAQRKGPCPCLYLLLLCVDHLQSNIQITGLKKKLYCSAFLRSSQIQILLGFNLAWDFDFRTGSASITCFLDPSLQCTKDPQFPRFPVWTEGTWQLPRCSTTQYNIISSFLCGYTGFEWRIDQVATSGLCVPRCVSH